MVAVGVQKKEASKELIPLAIIIISIFISINVSQLIISRVKS